MIVRLFAVAALAQVLWFASGELIDDAYITFRYAKNWVDGVGVVFNPGERVEGYTNFAWLALVALGMRLGIAAEIFARVAGATSLAASILVVGAWWRGDENDAKTPTSVAMALLASCPLAALWAVHGLETTFFGLLVLAGVGADLSVRRPDRRIALSALLLGLAALTRPEGVLIFFAHAAVRSLFVDKDQVLHTLLLRACLFFAIVAPHFAWRASYYGDLVPNTFHAKVGLTPEVLARGFDYVRSFVWGPAGLIFLLAPFAFLRPGRERVVIASAIVTTIAVVVVLEGGDSFGGFRFLMPALPFLYLLVGEGGAFVAGALERRGLDKRFATGLLVALALAHVVGNGLIAVESIRAASVFTSRMRLVGTRLGEVLPPDTLVAVNPIGAIGFLCRCRILDMLGLADRHIARTKPADLGQGVAGHEKGDGAYVLERHPDLILFGNVMVSTPGTSPEIGLSIPWPPVHRSERELASLPALGELYARDVIGLAEDRHLLVFRRRDFSLPKEAAPRP